MCTTIVLGEKVILCSLPGHTTHYHHSYLLLYYGSIDVGMQEFLPVMFHSLFLANNQKFIAPHVGFRLLAKYCSTCLQGVHLDILDLNISQL